MGIIKLNYSVLSKHMLAGYRNLRQISETPNSIIYRGIREQDNLFIIIKLIKQEYPLPETLERYRQEYEIINCLNDSGIVKAYDLIRYQNRLAIILEDWAAQSLSDLLSHQTLQLKTILEIGIEITTALQSIHQANIIHKDINPSNILYNQATKKIKIIDFGIATQLPKEQKSISNYKTLEGTLAYISPEQTGRMNRGLDYRSDYYSLGVTLYQLLTKQLPFEAEEPRSLIHDHLAKIPPSPRQISSEIPQTVSKIVMKLMAKNAEERYQSTSGLIHDLEICLNQLHCDGKITEFKLGQQDKSSRFIIPDKLYGRESEVKVLLESFERVAQGKSEMILVAGFSGIGKTAVVNEVHKPITKHNGYFIKGKFDQYNRDIPFSAFVEAFSGLVKQLLAESDEQLDRWKIAILSVLGKNAQVIIEVISNLEIILGKQPAVTELSGSAAQNRFNLVFSQFVQVFTKQEYPLVIFLDDLQWADSASLGLLKLLMSSSEGDTNSLLVLGAYRDNEVFPAHPLMLCLQEIERERASLNTITLEPLKESDINNLVADTLSRSPTITNPLSGLIYQKTQGNPFFTTQFLKGLYEDGYISFISKANYWQCDLTNLKQVTLTNDVVEFMVARLQKLPETTQHVLKLAACIGNRFDLDTLTIICERSKIEITDYLWLALQAGLIVPESQIYRLYAEDRVENLSEEGYIEYRFLHDRVQQVAYSLIPDRQKQTTHYRIGKRLLENTPQEILEEQIFAIINQLNFGIDRLSQPEEKEELARLNLIACRKAKNATAHRAGREYACKGRSLLATNSWQKQYEMTFALTELAAEFAVLCGYWEEVNFLVREVVTNSNSFVEQASLYRLQIQSHTSRNQMAKAIAVALGFLQQLGVTFPENPTEIYIENAISNIQKLIGDLQVEDLLDLPEMIDAEKIAIVQIAQSIFSATYISSPHLLFPLVVSLAVSLSIQYGNIPPSGQAYACYGLILSAYTETDVIAGVKFGQLALQLADKLAAKTAQPEVLVMAGGFLLHRTSPIRETLPLMQAGYTNSLEVGNLEFAGYNAHHLSSNSFWSGCFLKPLAEKIGAYCCGLEQMNQLTTANYLRIYWQTTLNLLGRADNLTLLSGEALQEKEALCQWQTANDVHALFVFHTYKLMLCFLFGKLEEARAQIDTSRQYLPGGLGTVNVPAFYFYASLTTLATVQPDSDRIAEVVRQVEADLASLKQWSKYASMNYQHKVDLVEAEKYRVLGQKIEAIELYDRAIARAKDNEYIQEEALANELAAKFYLNWGKEKIAAVYLQEAYYCYERWGAKAKTDRLEKLYLKLLRPILQAQDSVFNPLQALSTLSTYINKSHCSIGSNSKSADTFDLQNRIRLAEAITETLELEQLLTKISEIFLQQSGCDRFFIALTDNWGTWKINASADPENIEIHDETSAASGDIPEKLINYVKKTQEKLIVNELATELTINDNYVIARKPKSLLVLPLKYQEKLVGILYLHSTNISNIFSAERIVVLEFLSSQVAIAINNARLYESHLLKSSAIEASAEGISILENGKYIYLNPSHLEILGYEQHELLGASWEKLYDSAEIKRFQENIFPLLNEEGKWFGEATAMRKDGSSFPQEVSLCSLDDNKLICICRDISDRKKAEQELVQKQNHLEALLNNIPHIAWLKDSKSHFIAVNKPLAEMLETSPDAIVGKTDFEFSPDDIARGFQEDDLRVLTSGKRKVIEERYRRGDGSWGWLETIKTPFRDPQGKLAGTVGISMDISDRKAAEESLIQSENKFRTLVSNIHGAVYRSRYDANWTIDYMSPAIKDLSGYPAEEFIQNTVRTYISIIHPEDIDYIDREVSVAVAKQESFILEYRILHRDGTIRWVFEKGKGFHNSEGEILYFEGVIFDISDRKQAEEALALQQNHLKALLNNIPHMVWLKDAESRFIAVNKPFAEACNHPGENLVGKTDYDIWSRKMAEGYRDDDLQVLASGTRKVVEEKFSKPDGTMGWLETTKTPFRNARGEIAGTVGIAADISDRKAAEQKLYESQQLLQLVLDTIPQLVFWKDKNSVFLGCNQAFADIAGLNSPEEIIGKSDCELPWKPQETACFWDCDLCIMSSGQAELGIIEPQLTAEGKQIWLKTNKSPLINESEEIFGILGTIEDITAQKEAEQTLKRINEELEIRVSDRTLDLEKSNQALERAKEKADAANQAKSIFLTKMSHELRTPLNGILGYAQILQKDGTLSTKQAKRIDIIYKSGNHLLNLINDILDFSKIEAGKMELSIENIQLQNFIESIVSTIEIQTKAKDLEFNYQGKVELLPVVIQADEKRLRQILLNLLGNAVKFTKSGQITLRVSSNQPNSIDSQNQQQIKFQVEDTGVGMSREQISQIFQPFEQVGDSKLKAEGTGLGLSISHELVELMGGQLQIKSQINHGSIFWFEITVPCINYFQNVDLENKPILGKRIIGYQGQRKKITIVDEITENCLFLKNILEPLDFDLAISTDRQKIKEIVKKIQPDCILLDLVMLRKMGHEVLAEIRQLPELKEVIIIVLSEKIIEPTEKKILDCNAFISKPVDKQILLETLHKQLKITYKYQKQSQKTLISQVLSSEEISNKLSKIKLPQEEKELLHELAQLGNIKKIKQRAKYLEKIDEHYVPLANRLLQLAQNFQTDAILEMVEKYFLP